MDEESRKQEESDVERNGPGGRLEVPPVIIKGGSIEVEFKAVDFDDGDNHTKVKKVKHPHSTRILKVDVMDYQKNVLNSYRIPAGLDGKCLIYIWDDAV